MNNLVIFLTTVGEEITFEALDSLVCCTPEPYKLVIWYDACGRGVDDNFIKRLKHYTKDIIVVHEDKGLVAAIGFGLLYLDYEYLIWCAADMLVLPGYFERLRAPFLDMEVARIGAAGECWPHPNRPMKGRWELSDPDRCIDGVVMISKEAINAVGSMSPAYWGTGPFHFELQRRMANSGWAYAAVGKICIHGGKQHEGRDLNPRWKDNLDKDNRVWLEAEKNNFTGYNWWDSEQKYQHSKLKALIQLD